MDHPVPWSMVIISDNIAQNILCTYDVNNLFRKKTDLTTIFRCNQMPSANRITWFSPYVRSVLCYYLIYVPYGYYWFQILMSQFDFMLKITLIISKCPSFNSINYIFAGPRPFFPLFNPFCGQHLKVLGVSYITANLYCICESLCFMFT